MNLQDKDLKYIWHPCSQMKDYEELLPIVIERGEGVYLYDDKGRRFLDIISSWWCNLLGHTNPVISQRIKEQLNRLEHVIFANFTHCEAIELCERLVQYLPAGLIKFHFNDNGSASVECALKMSFQYQQQIGQMQRRKFMCLSDGYHGETLGALSVGTLDLYAKLYQPLLIETKQIVAPDCYRCLFQKDRQNCSCECFIFAEKTFAEYGETACAMIVEPLLQGSAGMRMYPSLYLRKLRALCNQYGVLLIADEIATGFGRTGKMFAFDYANVSPDIMCLSKGLTGGFLPMSLTITTDRIYHAFYGDYHQHIAFMHSHTYAGNPLGCAAALGVLDVLENENILDLATKRSFYLTKKLNEALGNHQNVGEIRHLGLIHAIELVADRQTKKKFNSSWRIGYQIYKKALELGLLLRPLGDILYFNPPLIITESQIDEAVVKCLQAMDSVLGKSRNYEKR
ncbi:MAG: adenosylmethionine--8-amino-7-oxononanoate transaminase [Streptococcaceae bacterium]|jgi:adenosylmethionine-8-amino-7-oxononanoate aminotransferase|nr:adenosylmethionine--8-amino-7-oxononanoate transaminase [Streptococcaceae bacterium]